MCLCCAENVQKTIGVSQGNTTLKYTIQDSMYFEGQIYIFIYRYTKILQFGALASWGLKNKSIIISTKAFLLSRSKQQDISIFLYHILMKALWIFREEALRCAAKNNTPPRKRRFIFVLSIHDGYHPFAMNFWSN